MLIDLDGPSPYDPDARPVAAVARPLGIRTNNWAEWTAVVLALERARALGASEVELVLDSKLVVEQLLGRWRVREPSLVPLRDRARDVLVAFRHWTASHEGRASNRAADALANLALDDPAAASALEAAAPGTPGVAAVRPPVKTAGDSSPEQSGAEEGCAICAAQDGDAGLRRVEVWRDEVWRLTISLAAPVLGFAYLEPHRHVPSLAELEGQEASTLGTVLSRVVRALRDSTEAERVYVYVFGERMPHLHFNLAPHRPGDPLRGGQELADPSAPVLPEARLAATARRVRLSMADR